MILEDDTQQGGCSPSDSTAAVGASHSEPPTPIMCFVHFLSACSTDINSPLEEALRQSIELAQFIDASSSQSFLPHHETQVRRALWELLGGARVREQYAVEIEKQFRLYGGPSAGKRGKAGGNNSLHTSDASSSASTLFPSATPCDEALAPGDESSARAGRMFRHASVSAECAFEGGEETFLTALRSRGQFLPRAPRHAAHCARRISSLSFSNALPHVGLARAVADLSVGCALCVAEGLLRATWLSLRCAQLIGVAAAAHICAAPLRIPREALSTTPREAICIGHHLAQLLLRCAVRLLLSVAEPPVEEGEGATVKKCHDEGEKKEEKINETVAEREHYAKTRGAIVAVGHAGLDSCVMLLSALRRLQPSSAPLVLLQATAIAFCDRQGVPKAQRMLREWCDAQASNLSGGSTKEANLNNDEGGDYKRWLRLSEPEDVATGILFSVFLQLLSLRDSPMRDAPLAAPVCLSARNALDAFVHPRLLSLCDAADGATSARGHQALALHWLLRGTLCHILNALAAAPPSLLAPPRAAIVFDESAPAHCARAAARAAEAAREFSTETLAPPWLTALGEIDSSAARGPAGDGRLSCGSEAIDRHEKSGEAAGVSELALLPVPVMRMWSVLGVTVFRSASGDLLAADNADSAERSAANLAEMTALGREGTHAKDSAGGQSKEAKELSKYENAQRMEEVQRKAETSSLAFWYRWRETMTLTASCTSSPLNILSVLERHRRLILFACGEEKEENVTIFMSALRDAHPIAVSSEAAFDAARLLPQRKCKEDEKIRKRGEECLLATLDPRLEAACRLYDRKCIRPLVADALSLPSVSASSGSKAASGSAMRAVQQKQRLRNTAQKHK